METANSISEINWKSIGSILHSGFILTFQNQPDALAFIFRNQHSCSEVRKPLQPHTRLNFMSYHRVADAACIAYR